MYKKCLILSRYLVFHCWVYNSQLVNTDCPKDSFPISHCFTSKRCCPLYTTPAPRKASLCLSFFNHFQGFYTPAVCSGSHAGASIPTLGVMSSPGPRRLTTHIMGSAVSTKWLICDLSPVSGDQAPGQCQVLVVCEAVEGGGGVSRPGQ